MIRLILSIALVAAMASLSSASSELTAGENMFELRGEYLSGREAILPKDASGHVTLLLFGFTYQSRFAVEASIISLGNVTAPIREGVGHAVRTLWVVTMHALPAWPALGRLALTILSAVLVTLVRELWRRVHPNLSPLYGR
jgi:hypothetical protein